MSDVHAHANVARVQHVQPSRNRAVCELPRENMSANLTAVAATTTDPSVSAAGADVGHARPKVAVALRPLTGRSIDLRLESLNQGPRAHYVMFRAS